MEIFLASLLLSLARSPRLLYWKIMRRGTRADLFLWCFVFSCSLFVGAITSTSHSSDISGSKPDTYSHSQQVFVGNSWRRQLVGPGSYPPRCTGKCGRCAPCRPVHVPVPPGTGTHVVGEYYPEAWRCKCGNRLYIP
ncbi:EPIDERMAL PATTERNING FACTOR-like protein 6 [Iris pallida]|uniref:Epidermal patterning factor-like protein n=1 Tax=Iris pallida TaxID=29817 RepID=A0AAX6FVL4_IRIPA|nr:EPIDERMAL PATTERNING FACTOR-like protein 6 [Iris pallida]KAJ6839674.1 EPIDERMAL PATTERNING FACTOR-like protein 6 [Iris pallida]